MKKLFIALSLMLLSLCSYGQLEMYRTYELLIYDIDIKTEQVTNKKVYQNSTLLVFDVGNNVLTINHDKPIKIFLSSFISKKELEDQDGDMYIEITWNCIDDNGEKIMLISADWPDYTNRNFIIITEKNIVEYKCRILN